MGTLDSMAFALAQKDNKHVSEVKNRLVNKINMLSEDDAKILVVQMAALIDRSINHDEKADESNVQKEFVSFLIRLFY
jgi:hypothetical protein